jgi:hypothetical protein
MWCWSGDSAGFSPLSDISEDEIFSEEELETISEREYEVVPAPWGVRYRMLTEAEFEDLEWQDLGGRGMTLGRIDRWRTWQDRLCA